MPYHVDNIFVTRIRQHPRKRNDTLRDQNARPRLHCGNNTLQDLDTILVVHEVQDHTHEIDIGDNRLSLKKVVHKVGESRLQVIRTKPLGLIDRLIQVLNHDSQFWSLFSNLVSNMAISYKQFTKLIIAAVLLCGPNISYLHQCQSTRHHQETSRGKQCEV